jgi:rare lipoprotein A
MNLTKIWKFLWKSRLAPSIIILFISILLFTEAEDTLNQPLIFEAKPSQDLNLTIRQNYIDSLNQVNCFSQEGIASYYGKRFHNRKTASGLRYNMNKFTAAHRTISFGNIIKITNLKNGSSTLALINDRGPFIRKRILDLSKTSAKQINGLGIPKVQLETLTLPDSIPEDIQKYLYLAFSIKSEPRFVDDSQIMLLRQSNDFSEIVELLHSATELAPNDDFYLIVSVNDYGKLSSENTYWLGTLRQNKIIANIY